MERRECRERTISMTLVVMAAGMGSRYGGLKQLDPMTEHGEVILDFSVYNAKRAGFDKVVFVIKKEMEDLFREKVGNRMEKQIQVEYAYQALDMLPKGAKVPEGRVKPWGTGHALLCAKEAVGKDNLMVINADDFYGAEAFAAIGGFLAGTPTDSPQFSMAGFVLKNTLTENGSVSRGICVTDKEGFLSCIDERTKIYRRADGQVVYFENDVEYPTDENGYVSMNCWGFTPQIFDFLESGFEEFIKSSGQELKKEFYLPACVDAAMKKGACSVKVLPTHHRWYGVTYPEDKASVVSAIKSKIESGEYPDGLFEQKR